MRIRYLHSAVAAAVVLLSGLATATNPPTPKEILASMSPEIAISADGLKEERKERRERPSAIHLEGKVQQLSPDSLSFDGAVRVIPPDDTIIHNVPSKRDTVEHIAFMDWNHPKNYINLYEVTKDYDTLPIYIAKEYRDSGLDRSVNRDVDVDSKIIITFDRKWLLKCFDHISTEITMTGHINDRQIEIPGYSQIGLPLRVSKTGATVTGMLGDFRNAYKMSESIIRGFGSADSALTYKLLEIESLQRELRYDSTYYSRRQLDSIIFDQRLGRAKSKLLSQSIIRGVDSTVALDTSLYYRALKDSAAAIDEQLSTLRFSMESMAKQLSSASQSLDSTDSLRLSKQVEKEAQMARQKLLDQWPIIHYGLTELANADSIAAMTVLDEQMKSTPRYLEIVISTMDAWVAELKADTAKVDTSRAKSAATITANADPNIKASQVEKKQTDTTLARRTARRVQLIGYICHHIQRLHNQLEGLFANPEEASAEGPDESGGFGFEQMQLDRDRGYLKGAYADSAIDQWAASTPFLSKRMQVELIGLLKDAEVLIAKENANPGDVLVLEIANGATLRNLHRSFNVRLNLGEFGLRKRLSDSFMFLYRKNTPDVIPGDPGILESVPKPMNFEPAPGVTLAWTLYVRDNDTRKLGSLTKVVRFLTPGFGVNVSFPRFGNKLVSKKTGEPVTYSESDNDLGISAGPVLTFFDGAIQITNGWMISNVRSNREYFGIGFSFIKGISKIKEVAQ
ncbi:MAG: hypothetical protein WAU88_12415 [Candidatus Zixiibacteriota bacterium]